MVIKAVKGFDKNLQCKDMQFEIGKTYEHKGKVKCCSSGFHSCENPLHVLRYYPAANSRFCEVEVDGKIDRHNEDSKIASSKITIGEEISLKSLIEAGFKFVFEKIKWGEKDTPQTHGDYSVAQTHGISSTAQTHGYSSAAQTHGDYSTAQTHGYYSAAQTRGYSSAAQTRGNSSTAQTHGFSSAAQTRGDNSAAQTHGNFSAAQTHGNNSAAQTHGNNSAAQTHGYSSAAQTRGNSSAAQTLGFSSVAQTHGDYSAAQTHGNYSAAQTHGNESIAVSTGIDGKASGALGNWLVLAEWEHDKSGDLRIKSVKSEKVDGVKIKANTWYTLENGKFVSLGVK